MTKDGVCRYYARNGKTLTLDEWAKLFEDKSYQILKHDWLEGKRILVSTVWLGLDHNFMPGGRRLIFETMVFDHTFDVVHRGDLEGIDGIQERYSTEKEALRGHARILQEVQDKLAHTEKK